MEKEGILNLSCITYLSGNLRGILGKCMARAGVRMSSLSKTQS